MLISIIIPSYNAECFISATIESVIGQSHREWELIVADDGSTDGTVELVRKLASTDARIKFEAFENSGAASVGRNRGSQKISPNASYVLFLDHDDILEQDALKLLSETLEANPQSVAAYGLARYIDLEGRPIRAGEAESYVRNRIAIKDNRLVPVPLSDPLTFSALVYSNCICSPGQVMIRRSSYEAVGPWDPTVSPSTDRDMWMRLSLAGEVRFVDFLTFDHRQHHSNQSKNRALMQQGDMKLRKKWSQSTELSHTQRLDFIAGWKLWDRHLMSLRQEWALRDWRRGDVVGCLRNLIRSAVDFAYYFQQWGTGKPAGSLPRRVD
jgi:glycosyltransferase involved in cell wall biosynthesis